MKRWGLVIALLLSLGVNIGLLATAAMVRLRPLLQQRAAPKPPFERVERLADRLGLTGEVRRQFVARQIRFFDEAFGLRADLEDIHRELRREITRPRPDPAKVKALLEESETTYHSLEQAMVDHVLESRALLDPAQERRFVDLIRRMRAGPFNPPLARPNQRPGLRPGGFRQGARPGAEPPLYPPTPPSSPE